LVGARLGWRQRNDRLYRHLGPRAKTCTWTTGPLSCTVSGLTNCAVYTFMVTHQRRRHGPASAASSPVTPAPPVGLLRLTTSPALPAQISANGVIADAWGLNWLELSPGAYTVHFSHVEGYAEPADQVWTVTAGATTTVTGTFIARGELHVTTSLALPGQISVDGHPGDDWGLWTDESTGSHSVCFGPVAGYAAPVCQVVSVSAGSTTSVTGLYD
jgi:hypothetical protein